VAVTGSEAATATTAGNQRRAAGESAGLSARELDKRLSYSHMMVPTWEHGMSEISLTVLAQLLDQLRSEILARYEAQREWADFVKERRG
jgi:hypothetical protein